MEQQREANKKWAMAVYKLGFPFSIFTHKVFKEAYKSNRHLPRYVFPGSKKLSNDLLNGEYEELKKDTDKLMFLPQGYSKLTFICNGWNNIQVAAFRQHGLEMATSSRGDKGKAPMVEQKDIGTEEGELLDVRPPLPEPVRRSGGHKKRKKPAGEEEGPLAVALLPPTAEEKRAENARKKAEKEEKYRQNSIFMHRWFVWFTQETNNQTPLEKRFFTPGSLRGIQNFRSHLMELAIVKFLEEKEKPNVRPWETSVSTMSQRLARFLEEVPKNWDKHFDVWLKSREFEIWTEDAVRQKGEKPLLIIPGLTMRNDEEKKKWKRTAELWAQWFQPPKSIKDYACTSAKYKACESMSDDTICFISKDSFTMSCRGLAVG
ncbi:hypothetical protein R1sor_010298 [Riccia sorocarpa]|uniref:DDE-1 domain-containing protein n=1 Tax=Riccia sorocarpa TaxID=122646 RepID=A0ABD3I1A5_9MARC